MIEIIGHYNIKLEHFRAEIGYMILTKYSGQGFIAEAVKAAVQYAFDVMKLHSIAVLIQPNNLVSAKVLVKKDF